MSLPVFIARRDARLRARITSDRQLVYDGPPGTSADDRPRHVRAGSGLAWSGERIVVIQDDADYVGIIDGDQGSVAAVPLRSPGGGHFGKTGAGHMNLEAVVAAKDWRGDFLLAFGSGSAPEKRMIARVRLGGGDTELSAFEARKLYAAIAEIPDFTAQGLHLEGVALLPKAIEGRDAIRLFHGAVNPELAPGEQPVHLSATVDLRLDSLLGYLDRCKRDPNAFPGVDLVLPRRYNLNDLDGVPFRFSDAATAPDGRVVYLAVAERLDEQGHPRACAGTALGVIEPDGNARYTVISEKSGQYSTRRAEGMALHKNGTGYLVIQDDEDGPAVLAALEISGL